MARDEISRFYDDINSRYKYFRRNIRFYRKHSNVQKINYNDLSYQGKQQYNSFVDESTNYFMTGFWTFFAFMSMILLALAYFRLSNGQEPISIVNVFDFVSNHFSDVAELFAKIKIPSLTVSSNVPKFLEGFVGFWNNLINVFNVLGYLLSVVVKVMYTMISILVWVLTGITI